MNSEPMCTGDGKLRIKSKRYQM